MKPPAGKGKIVRVTGRVVLVGPTTAQRAGLPEGKVGPFRNKAAVAARSASAVR